MEKGHNEADKNFQLQLIRIGLVCVIVLLAYCAFIFIGKKPNPPTSNIYVDTVYVRTNDAVMSTIIVKYVFDKSHTKEFYNQNIHFPVAEALQTNALEMNWNQLEIIADYQTMAMTTVKQNLIHIVWKDVIVSIEHDPRVLKLLEQRNQAVKNDN